MIDAWLTEDEACRLVRRTPRTLKQWRTDRIVACRRRRGTIEYRRVALLRAAQRMDNQYRDGRRHHPHREEGIQWLREAIRQQSPLPDDAGLARMCAVSVPCARNWRTQWLSGMPAATFEHSNREIAARANTTEAVAHAARQLSKRRKR